MMMAILCTSYAMLSLRCLHPRAAAVQLSFESIESQIEAFIATDKIQHILSQPFADDDDGEWADEEDVGSSLAPDHARPISVLDESVFVKRAWAEERYLSRGERKLEPIKSPGGSSAAALVLEKVGIGRLPEVLSEHTVTSLRAFILDELADAGRRSQHPARSQAGAKKQQPLDEPFKLVQVGSGTQRLSDERGRSTLASALTDALNPTSSAASKPTPQRAEDGSGLRWDLRLPSSAPPVRLALTELLGENAALGGAIATLAGENAEMWELAAIVSAPAAAP